MRLGEIEYTRVVIHNQVVSDTPEFEDVAFALGIKIRPLLVRAVAAWNGPLLMIANASIEMAVRLQNGQAATPASVGAADADQRLMPLLQIEADNITTGGNAVKTFQETTWWKLLMPAIRIHFWNKLAHSATVVLHYRFAELTDDEIIEIAAQRAQE